MEHRFRLQLKPFAANPIGRRWPIARSRSKRRLSITCAVAMAMFGGMLSAFAQSAPESRLELSQLALQQRVSKLETEVAELKAVLKQLQSTRSAAVVPVRSVAKADADPQARQQTLLPQDRKASTFFKTRPSISLSIPTMLITSIIQSDA